MRDGVISYEGMHLLPDPALDLLAARAREAAAETWAVMFLRRQDDYAESLANQKWKAHRVSWQEAHDTELALLEGRLIVDYEAILSRLEARFDRLMPLVYDKRRSTDMQFSEATGLDLVPPPSAPDPNPALGAVGLATLREVKRLAGERADLFDVVEATHPALHAPGLRRRIARFRDGPVTIFGAEQRERIMSRHAASNERVRAPWFPERSELFPPFPAGIPAPRSAQARRDVVRRIQGRFGLTDGCSPPYISPFRYIRDARGASARPNAWRA